MNYVKRFLNGKWLKMAASYLANPAKMRMLIDEVGKYVSKKGLQDVKMEMKELLNFVKNVSNGTYKGYSKSNLLLAVAALIYVVSPLDIVPDLLVGLGFLDDVAIVGWAISKLGEELGKYKQWIRAEEVPAEEVKPEVADGDELGVMA